MNLRIRTIDNDIIIIEDVQELSHYANKLKVKHSQYCTTYIDEFNIINIEVEKEKSNND